MAEEIKVPGILRPGTGTYHGYSKDIIDDQLRNKTQAELNILFNQGKGLDENGNVINIVNGPTDADGISYRENLPASDHAVGSTGRKIKELEDRIDNLTPTEIPILEETVDLDNYMVDDNNNALSFIYDLSSKYVYQGKATTMCTYGRNGNSYAAFKVVDIDKYIIYIVSSQTFTYHAINNSEILSNEARNVFELGRYALIKQLQGITGDYFIDGKVSVFVDTNNRPLLYRYVTSIELGGQTISNVLLTKTIDNTAIFVYNRVSGTYKFYSKILSSSSSFNDLDALIDGGGSSGGVIDYNDLINKPTIITDYNDLTNKPITQKDNENGYVLGNGNSASGTSSIAEGNQTVASGS